MAGGVLFYRSELKDVEFLMINLNGRYEDFGGRTDPVDKSIKETIVREVIEESNGIFTKEFVYPKINKHGLYIKSGKYLVYFIKLKKRLDVRRFGTLEMTEQIERTVEWINGNKLVVGEVIIHPRLRNEQVLNEIKNIINLNKGIKINPISTSSETFVRPPISSKQILFSLSLTSISSPTSDEDTNVID